MCSRCRISYRSLNINFKSDLEFRCKVKYLHISLIGINLLTTWPCFKGNGLDRFCGPQFWTGTKGICFYLWVNSIYKDDIRQYGLNTLSFFFIRTKFIRTSKLELPHKTKNICKLYWFFLKNHPIFESSQKT